MNEEPPVREAIELRNALEGVRRARAKVYAPRELAAAEASAEQAISFCHRTVSEKTGVLNYDLVRLRLKEARRLVDVAWRKARGAEDKARSEAEVLIEAGARELGEAEASIKGLPIGVTQRAQLARARVALASARAHWRSGEWEGAAKDARFALEASEETNRRAGSFLRSYTTSDHAAKWARWFEETVEHSRRTGDSVVIVDKLRRRCHLYRAGVHLRSYKADLGGPLWDKMRAGDRATPEGKYRIVRKRPQGQTEYYKALLIDYPNNEDRIQFAQAKKKGWIPRHARIGGLIEIHGGGGRNEDWTLGCVALANRDIDDLFEKVQVGTPVTIVGTITRGAPVSG